MARYLNIDSQFFDNNGDPLSGGGLYFYDTGTTDAKTVYSNVGMSIAHSQPVDLDAYGVPPDIYFTGTAKVVLKDADGVQLRSMDPVSPV